MNPYLPPKSGASAGPELMPNRILIFCIGVTILAVCVPLFHFGFIIEVIKKQRGIVTYIGSSGNIRSYLTWLGGFTPALPVFGLISCGLARCTRKSWLMVSAGIVASAVILFILVYFLQVLGVMYSDVGE